MRVKRLAALLRAELDDRPPAALESFLEEFGQDPLERLALEMIEENLAHATEPRDLGGRPAKR